MAVTLHVDRPAWDAHVRSTWDGLGDVVPVVKGNGYGFGRARLAGEALRLGADELAVGTIHELAALPSGPAVTVLTPALAADVDPDVPAILTVASTRHVDELTRAGFRGAVVVKLATSLRRFGVEPTELDGLLDEVGAAGLTLHAFGLHFPLASTSSDHAAEVAAWLPSLPQDVPLHISHVDAGNLARLHDGHPGRRLRARTGTTLWHGDKAALRLAIDVLDVRALATGQRAGYRLNAPGPAGHLVVVSGGTAQGIHPLPDGRSPFHHRRTRLALLEPPHMHTSMLFVPDGQPLPAVGDELDLQRPLTQTWPDRIVEHHGVHRRIAGESPVDGGED